MVSNPNNATDDHRHPRSIGWIGTVALAMGGSNQSLFLITALFAGQNDIPGQGSAAVALLIVGLLVSYAAAPGWTELILMSPDRVGGISAACTAAFKPYSPILSALTGVCYWWGWVPTCGVTALLSGTAINAWCLPSVPIPVIACTIVAVFTIVNLCGVKWVARLAVPFATASALLAFVSMLAPVLSGAVDWNRTVDFHLTMPFSGWFGALTSTMAGLYLIGFGAPAFEAAACHVGETVDPERNVPRAMFFSGVMAAVYFAILPVVWLGALGPAELGRDIGEILGPTFAPVFGSGAKAATIGFMMFNMFHGTLQPLAGAARTLSQIAEDGLAPRFLARRMATDAPWVASLCTAGFAIGFLLIGDPIWLIAAANFTYLIGICMPSVAVWLLRRDQPELPRPYRAPRYTIGLGLLAAAIWGCSALLGFEQFGLPTVLIGLLMAYSGAFLYSWRKLEDRWHLGLKGIGYSLHVKLTGAMLAVLALDGGGYIMALRAMPKSDTALATALADIFVLVALLTISVGLVLPGMIAHSVDQVRQAARHLVAGTVGDFVKAMDALGQGRLEAAYASIDITPVIVNGRDEIADMAESFNRLQFGIKQAALGLDQAREGLSRSRSELLDSNATLAATVADQRRLAAELVAAKEKAVHDALHDDLTALPNRTFFLTRVEDALRQAATSGPYDFAVFFVDLDHFKVINDSLGHLVGNALIVQAATRLSSNFADVPQGNVVARLGGDEFTILMKGVENADRARAIATRLIKVLAIPFLIEGREVYTSASIGIVLGCADYSTPNDMLRDADLAMYRAKSLGRGRAEIFEPSMYNAVKVRLDLENDMREALESGHFLLHYQPIVALDSGKLLGLEALVRWQHPERGLVAPGEFIPVAEANGFIIPLGMWVLREACRTLVNFEMRFGRDMTPGMSVNLSPKQFEQADIVEQIETVIRETGAPADLLKLEFTESATIGDPERAVRVMTQIKALGPRLSIDDFGTGYSSLSYLHRLPADVMKIDRSFVLNLTRNAESRQIINTILRLADTLGMDVVAEGIEEETQASELRKLGCKFGQGFLYSRPVDLATAESLFVSKMMDADPARPLREVLDAMRSKMAPGKGLRRA